MKFASAATAVSALVLPGLAITVPASAPIPGYSIFIPEWEVEVTPGGEKVLLNGTVEEVYHELVKLNPNYDVDFADQFAERKRDLAKRDLFPQDRVGCNPGPNNWDLCRLGAIEEGIDYLKGLSGHPRNGGGPGACGRVSCSYNAAIYWCNDSREPKTINSFGDIATGAQAVNRKCKLIPPSAPAFGTTGGQAFTLDNWNVIVRGVKGAEHC